jgi:NAD+ synthase
MRAQQEKIIDDLNVQPTIDPRIEIERRSNFLAEYLGGTGLNGFVLGISGGQDSLLAGLLAQRAVEIQRRKGRSAEFHAMLLPYGEQRDRSDAELAIKTIRPDMVHDFDIKPGVDAIAETFLASEHSPINDFDKGNVKARVRMLAQYAIAGAHGLLVVGTDHAAEAVTGFFTKYGDGGADILPLSGLTKRQGRAMLRELGVPEIFTTKAPTADLLDHRPGQADESELGLTYDAIDDYLEGKNVRSEIAEKIENRYAQTEHKRSLPIAPPPKASV